MSILSFSIVKLCLLSTVSIFQDIFLMKVAENENQHYTITKRNIIFAPSNSFENENN